MIPHLEKTSGCLLIWTGMSGGFLREQLGAPNAYLIRAYRPEGFQKNIAPLSEALTCGRDASLLIQVEDLTGILEDYLANVVFGHPQPSHFMRSLGHAQWI